MHGSTTLPVRKAGTARPTTELKILPPLVDQHSLPSDQHFIITRLFTHYLLNLQVASSASSVHHHCSSILKCLMLPPVVGPLINVQRPDFSRISNTPMSLVNASCIIYHFRTSTRPLAPQRSVSLYPSPGMYSSDDAYFIYWASINPTKHQNRRHAENAGVRFGNSPEPAGKFAVSKGIV